MPQRFPRKPALRVRSTEDEDSPKGYRSPKPGRAAERCLRTLAANMGFVSSLISCVSLWWLSYHAALQAFEQNRLDVLISE